MLTRNLTQKLLALALVMGYVGTGSSQVAPAKEGSMLTPPPVSVDAYPRELASEKRSNYLRLGMTVSGGYIDNLYAGSGNAVLAETTFSIRPLIAFDATSFRQQSSLLYSPGFTFYEPTSDLNQTDQNLVFNYRLRITPHSKIDANDTFQQGASSFNAGAAASGSTPSSGTGIIAPFAQRLTNNANGQYSLQFSPNSMVGITGQTFELHYPNTKQVPGLYDSREGGGGGFYNWRIASAQYVGVNYAYAMVVANPQGSRNETQTNSTYLYYTIYPKHGLAFSVTAGPQKYSTKATIPNSPTITSDGWSPSVTGSFGWQATHFNLSVGYSRATVAGNGLLGTFKSNSGGASARWQAKKAWIFSLGANYSDLKNVAPLPFFTSTLGGHSIAGLVTVDHSLSEHFGVTFEYDRLHQSYAGIPAVTSNPDSDREVGSIYWQFGRPLGR